MQNSTFTDSAITDDIPVKLDRIIYNAGKLPNNHINIGNPSRIGFFGVLTAMFKILSVTANSCMRKIITLIRISLFYI